MLQHDHKQQLKHTMQLPHQFMQSKLSLMNRQLIKIVNRRFHDAQQVFKSDLMGVLADAHTKQIRQIY